MYLPRHPFVSPNFEIVEASLLCEKGEKKTVSWRGFTLQVYVEDMTQARPWYEKLLGRKPDFGANPDFLEWEIVPDFWFQLVKKKAARDSARKRFGVSDIEHERWRIVEELGVKVTEVEELPRGVVKWCDFEDPWGNKLGLFQDFEKFPESKD